MAKRVAERELTDRNWDQEDDVEEVQYLDMSTRKPIPSIILFNIYWKHFTQLKLESLVKLQSLEKV